MHFCFALDDPVIFAGSLYERSKFIDAEKNCVIGSVHENFCGAVGDPSLLTSIHILRSIKYPLYILRLTMGNTSVFLLIIPMVSLCRSNSKTHLRLSPYTNEKSFMRSQVFHTNECMMLRLFFICLVRVFQKSVNTIRRISNGHYSSFSLRTCI